MEKSSKDIKKLISYSEGGITSKELLRSDSLDVTLFCMAKGTKISEHTSTKNGTVFVIEGEGTFNLKGTDIVMVPSTFINMEKNAIHSLKAKENTSFILTLSP